MAQIPEKIYAEASVRSVGQVSLFESTEPITHRNVNAFYSESQMIDAARERLLREGFEVLQADETTLTIAAAPEVYRKVFKTEIIAQDRRVVKAFGKRTTATFLDSPDTGIQGLIDTKKSVLADLIEGVALNEPVYFFASPFAPAMDYWHLDVPGDVALGLNASRAHRAGHSGRDIEVVMVDSGWFRHPFFVERGYNVRPVVLGPAAENPEHDEHGHGTGESANIFSVAPDAVLTMVKINFINAVGAFKAAVRLAPDIISCSWGNSRPEPPLSAADKALAAAVASAVAKGVIVVFSAGNGQFGFPGQHPDVIAAGGAFLHRDGKIEASAYASGFESRIYPGRRVPDVCGLVGQPPRARYIMLPVEPGDRIDRTSAGGVHPAKDETGKNDGWASFSGTSAAAPQIAGICALLKQANPEMGPSGAKEILAKTARDVTAGECHSGTGGHRAAKGPDLATGHGLADAHRAVLIARLRHMVGGTAGHRTREQQITEREIEQFESLVLGSENQIS